MPKKHYEVSDEPTEEAEPAPVEKAEVKEVHYTRAMWAGVKEIFKCAKCGTDRDDEDSMIEHILTHYPLEMQEDLFETLLKEK